MRIAVVTAYYKEPLDIIEKCYQSVKAQTFGDITHIMVADGYPQAEIDGWDVRHIKLPVGHNDVGDTPRMIGAASATATGFDAVAFLDADNTYEPTHFEKLHALHAQTGAPVITATRNIVRYDGTFVRVCWESNGNSFCDTNCYLITKPAFQCFASMGFKEPHLGIIGDRFLWQAVRQTQKTAHCSDPTVNYTATSASYYLQSNETPPPQSKLVVAMPDDARAHFISYEKYQALLAEGVEMEVLDLIDELRHGKPPRQLAR